MTPPSAATAGAFAQFQHEFAHAVLAPPGTPCTGVAAQPAFAVYRNTVMKGCIDALEANYPSVARLVGRSWFRSAAALHVAAHPPRDGRLMHYGEAFAEFLATFEPARELPYLPGVARLDRLWTEAHLAADAPPLCTGALARLAPERLGAQVLRPHPAARWAWFPAQPVYSIWQRNRAPSGAPAEPADTLDWHAEGALLTRAHGAVTWQAASAADNAFLDACAQGACLAEAAEQALASDPATDIAALLAGLLRAGALAARAVPTPSGEMP